MASHNEVGKKGEELAEAWLARNGYDILHRNWRCYNYEIDVIATKNEMLHIIEVKTLHDSPFAYPEDNVTRQKFRFIKQAATGFLQLHPQYKWMQYDILSITFHPDKEEEYFLLEDVFL